jgi:hypothetical protein
MNSNSNTHSNTDNSSKKYRQSKKKNFIARQQDEDDLEWGSKNPIYSKNSFPESEEYRIQSTTNSLIKNTLVPEPQSPQKTYKNLVNKNEQNQEENNQSNLSQDQQKLSQQSQGFFGRIMNRKVLLIIIIAVVVILVIAIVGFVFAFIRYKRGKKKEEVKVLEEKNETDEDEEDEESDNEKEENNNLKEKKNANKQQEFKTKSIPSNKNFQQKSQEKGTTLYVPKTNELAALAEKQKLIQKLNKQKQQDTNNNNIRFDPIDEFDSLQQNNIESVEKSFPSIPQNTDFAIKKATIPEMRNPSKVLKQLNQEQFKIKVEPLPEEGKETNLRQVSQNSGFAFLPVNNDDDEEKYLNLHKKTTSNENLSNQQPTDEEMATAEYLNKLRDNNDSNVGVLVTEKS